MFTNVKQVNLKKAIHRSEDMHWYHWQCFLCDFSHKHISLSILQTFLRNHHFYWNENNIPTFGRRYNMLEYCDRWYCKIMFLYKSTFTWDFISVESLNLVFSQFFTCIYLHWGQMKLKLVWISYRSFWPKWNFKPVWDFHVNKIYLKRNELAQTRWIVHIMSMCVWKSFMGVISFRSFWQNVR